MTCSAPRARRRVLPGAGLVAVAVLLAPALPSAANEDDVYIVQTNAAGDNVHLIDPASSVTSTSSATRPSCTAT